MTPKYIHANDRFVEVGISALCDIVIQVFFISESVEAFENEVKEGLQILRAGAGDENIGVAMSKCSSDC